MFSLLIQVAAGCGGSAFNDGSAAGGLGNATGGSVGRAGETAGGAGPSAGSGPVVGAAGGSGNLKRCDLPKDSGACDAIVPSFWHNPQTGLCEPFVYGGCEGNPNRFATRDDCLAACPSSDLAWGACTKDSECLLTTPGCCAGCEPLSDFDYLALNVAHTAEELTARNCPDTLACEPCPAPNELKDTGKYFKAVCVSAHCSAIDLRESRISSCTLDEQCTLRAGAECCAKCNGGFVPVNKNMNFYPDGPVSCPKCAAIQPTGVHAACVESHCVELEDR